MIFVSSSCVKNKYINESVKQLALAGFKNIELSGGTENYPSLLQDLIDLKEEYNLNFRCHNYFPPPPKDFIVNLASLNDEIYNLSIEHIRRAQQISSKLGANKFGVHAGFLINIELDEIGKVIKKKELFKKEEALKNFKSAISELNDKNVSLYIENNVLSMNNFKSFDKVNPLLMTESKEIKNILNETKVNFLLDYAHLKVSCNTLDLDINEELKELIPRTDYIHISDNNGLEDSNQELTQETLEALLPFKNDLINYDFTLEVYSGLESLRKSHDLLEEFINE